MTKLVKYKINMKKFNKALEYIGATAGVVGALLISLNIPESKYGFLIFLISSLSLTVFSYREKLKALMTMQVVFIAINSFGVYRWLL